MVAASSRAHRLLAAEVSRTAKCLGRHYSVDWTTGLDYWTHGNCLWGEKGAPMRRAKTPGHKVCSSVVVTHLKVASSSVPSHSALFLLLLYLDGNLGVATPRPRANKCAWALLVCDAVFQSGWVFFICPYCSPLLSRCFFS